LVPVGVPAGVNLIHLRHGLVDLIQSLRLFGAGRSHAGDHIGHFLDRRDDLVERAPSPADEAHSLLHLTAGIGDQILDVLRRLRGALRQAAYLRGYDPKAATRLACARRLHSRIERQQVGLAGSSITPRIARDWRSRLALSQALPLLFSLD